MTLVRVLVSSHMCSSYVKAANNKIIYQINKALLISHVRSWCWSELCFELLNYTVRLIVPHVLAER